MELPAPVRVCIPLALISSLAKAIQSLLNFMEFGYQAIVEEEQSRTGIGESRTLHQRLAQSR